MNQTKNNDLTQCPYENTVINFFNLPNDVKETDKIPVDFGILVNLLCYYDTTKQDNRNEVEQINPFKQLEKEFPAGWATRLLIGEQEGAVNDTTTDRSSNKVD